MKQSFFLLLLFLPFLHGAALTVDSGTLESALPVDELGKATTLSLSGTMDARDFKYLSDNMPATLSVLDLSQVEVTEYSDREALFGNQAFYGAGELPSGCFAGSPIREIALPKNLVSIGDGAFAGCLNLEALTIPSSVKQIGNFAFSGASALTNLNGGNAVEAIGDYAFSHCSLLSILPSFASLKAIGDYAFLNCVSMSDFDFPQSLEAIGEGAFKDTRLAALDLGNCTNLGELGAWAFAGNEALGAEELPSAASRVGEGIFYGCTSLRQASWAASADVGDFAFAGCVSIENAELPEGTVNVGNYAYSGAALISEFAIPSSVESIGERAFKDWRALSLLTSKAEVPPVLGDDVWEGVSKAGVYLSVPESSERAYRAAPQWRDFFNASMVDQIAENELRVVSGNEHVTLYSNEKIKYAELYDLAGILLASQRPECGEASFGLSQYGGKIFVARCVFDNGKAEIVKFRK